MCDCGLIICLLCKQIRAASAKLNFKKLNHYNIIKDIHESINKTNLMVNFKNFYNHSYECIQKYKK